MIFKDSRIYDVMKWIALVGLPALATLWFTVAKIWGLPFIGALIGISNIRYQARLEENSDEMGH